MPSSLTSVEIIVPWSAFPRMLLNTKSPLRGRVPEPAKLLRLPQDLDRPAAQRNAVLALGLHALSGNGPHHPGKVDLAPGRQPQLGRARRRQDQELERQPRPDPRIGVLAS